MPRNSITLTEHILKEEQKFPKASGNLTLLLTQIAEAGKIIASHVQNSGLIDIEGKTGKKNVYEEEVKKLDEFANDTMVRVLTESKQVFALASEEIEKPFFTEITKADYVVFFDPLDGSNNVDNNNPLGTIFSIYRKGDSLLQKGKEQVAAGYIFYGSSVMFVYSCGSGVNGFTLDPSVGSFLLSHKNITIPEQGSIYGVNEGNFNLFEKPTQEFILSLKKSKPYRLRWGACMVADVHRFLMNGGVFMYPKDKSAPNGKLRLMFEVNPMAYIITKAGGMALTTTENPLEINPSELHQRTPVLLGSPHEVKNFLKFHKK
ncbi:fructose-bisphosphatase [Candidatus Roizmanbacteria bacterium RIFCSPLOWO2_12_FULL_40_12]|uniref:Fructose-1,6-bisphosphatase class 1 n=1 Tax=Candidatus Roizmanbacteria bacterium RIFCSPLOWO2_01_FULL_40_42 TaxID=1802066 RepID=A0A1F7J602_9BACT|nr:MAG: fructose-bisphosphatase [Candidatus Roizmanbacteria bacterium RIFCSPHIGHO2_01_FULL_40_98]OGK27860.1 MAG: fructose-bisphosphatase [Candidatus Roizmanbacteria bacterium RIFCSPHIGHO2_02_FULL_40_53]OGK29410.1 MAG: fructose-bisphosphatase [Candidatus Roizmanbacteria bacterium RIFCSPHIGHO2_12_41_18]OGK36613.1 MAG: fructose-bisphosphatase [Candidatus Roizmanbacteria bacterium RIFCSPHIGHO2_12_FULL_40_130]OGK51051.1 MAG: fructose-bisphosphatase [Candidatus Roizmanbacteria bacterium RIFCSPLOWO2_0